MTSHKATRRFGRCGYYNQMHNGITRTENWALEAQTGPRSRLAVRTLISYISHYSMPNVSPVLLAEDNANDVLLIRRAFEENETSNPLHVVGNGQDAIRYLAGEGDFANRTVYPFPVLFLLDLKMPIMDGLEVLRWLHEHPEIPRKLPVVVLSSTELPNETQIAYAMDIQACIVKPLGYSELCERIRILKEYWLDYESSPAADAT
jgi:CheY-like chemotaxis protein